MSQSSSKVMTAITYGTWTKPKCSCTQSGSNEAIPCKVFKQGKVEPFPIIQTNRAGNSIKIIIEVFCYCRCPDNGNKIVCHVGSK